MKKRVYLSVGQVANRCGVKVSTLHYYEAQGLIKSWRNEGNQRRYAKDVIRRVSVIKAAQKMGISLQEIQQALSGLPDNRTPTTDDWQRISSVWHDSLNQRIQYLERLRDSITGCIGCGCLSMTACPIYNKDDKLALRGPGPIILEQGGEASDS